MATITPLAGVWIEIHVAGFVLGSTFVTPLAGVWIEIGAALGVLGMKVSHSPCGSVD